MPLGTDGQPVRGGFFPMDVGGRVATGISACVVSGSGFGVAAGQPNTTGGYVPGSSTRAPLETGNDFDFPDYQLLVHRRGSPFGSGWAIEDFGTLYRAPDRVSADILHGNGNRETFRPYPQIKGKTFFGVNVETALAVDRQTGQVFSARTSGFPGIYEINPATGAATPVATTPRFGDFPPVDLKVTYVAGQRVFLVATQAGLWEVGADGVERKLGAYANVQGAHPSVAGVGKYLYTTPDRTSTMELRAIQRVDLTDPTRTVVPFTPSDRGDLSLDPHGRVQAKDFWFLHPRGLSPASDGGLYVADEFRHAVYHLAPDSNGEVGPDSAVTRVVGSGVSTALIGLGRVLPGLEMPLRGPTELATAPDGTLLVLSNAGGILAYDPVERTARWVVFDVTSPLRNVNIRVAGGSIAPLSAASLFVPEGSGVFQIETPLTSQYDPTRVLTFNASGGTLLDTSSDVIQEYEWVNGALTEARLATERQRSGELLRKLHYQDVDRVSAVEDAAGRLSNFEYDSSGHISRITDAAGRTTHLTVDSAGNLREIVYPHGEARRFNYENYRMTEATAPNGESSIYTYAANGTLETAKRPGGGISTVNAALASGAKYDAAGRIYYESKFIDDRGVEHSVRMNEAGAIVADNFTAEGVSYNVANVYAAELFGSGSSTFLNVSNRLLRFSHTEVNGVPIGPFSFFNTDGQVVRNKINPDTSNFAQEFGYDAAKRLSVVKFGASAIDFGYHYDAAGHLVRVADQYENDGVVETGRESRSESFRTDGQPQIVTAHGIATTLGFDANGLLTSSTDTLGRSLNIVRDDAGNANSINDGSTTVQFSYDDGDRPTAITDALGYSTLLSYQSPTCGCSNGDRLSSLVTPDLPSGTKWSFTYDADGNPQTVTNPLQETETYAFDAHRDLVAYVDRGNRSTTFTYDSLGRKKSVTDALGRLGVFGYSKPQNGAWSGPTLYAQSPNGTPAPTSLTEALADGQYQVGTNGHQVGSNGSRITLYRDPTVQMSQWVAEDDLGRVTARFDRSLLPFASSSPVIASQAGPFDNATASYGLNGSPFALPTSVGSEEPELSRSWSAFQQRNQHYDLIGAQRWLGLGTPTLPVRPEFIPITRDAGGRFTGVSYLTTAGDLPFFISSVSYLPNGQPRQTNLNLPAIETLEQGSCRCHSDCAGRSCSNNEADCNKAPIVFGKCAEPALTTSRQLHETFEYDARGLVQRRYVARPLKPGTDESNDPYVYSYDAMGRNTVLIYPDGHTRQQSYDALGRLTTRCYSYTDGAPERCYGAEYDAAGNPKVLTDPEMRQEIAYDSLDRVIEVRRYMPANATTPVDIETYAYNALGGFSVFDGVAVDHLRSRLDGNGTASSAIPASVNGQPVGLDAGGRVTSLSGLTFDYFRSAHRLKSIRSASPGQNQDFSYDSLGRLLQVRRDVAQNYSEHYFYLRGGLDDTVDAIAVAKVLPPTPPEQPKEKPPLPETPAVFIYDGIDHPLAALVDSYRLVYYELDIIGNVRHAHADAAELGDHDLGGQGYTAFGSRIETGPGFSELGAGAPRWQSRPELPSAAGLYDFRARIWSTQLGAFLQPDEYVFLSRSGTLWSWPGQNPFRWRDPSGRTAEEWFMRNADTMIDASLAISGAAFTIATFGAGWEVGVAIAGGRLGVGAALRFGAIGAAKGALLGGGIEAGRQAIFFGLSNRLREDRRGGADGCGVGSVVWGQGGNSGRFHREWATRND